MTNDRRTEIAEHIDNMDEYSKIILGYPNWWASIPMPIASFLEEYNVSGKTIIPFFAHGGGRFGQSFTAIVKLAPETAMGEALAIHYSGGDTMPDNVTECLKNNGIIESIMTEDQFKEWRTKMIFDKTFTLNNGVQVPQMALGTWFIDDDKAAEAVRNAVEIGYRHIDTAQAYGNERGVGEGVRTCGIPREELLVTSKVAAECKDYDSAAKSIDETLSKMQLSYIDMMIIHSPQPWAEVNQSEDRYHEGNRQAWKALEDALEAGKVRAIGISNFLEEDIENILAGCRVRPMVNQILCHIGKTPKPLIDYCRDKGIIVEAYSPVGHGIALRNEKIRQMAEKYGVSIPQLCIRYDWQLDTIVLPKTANPEHMRSNAEIDFVISDEDMKVLMNMEETKDYEEFGVFPVYGGKM